MSPTKQAKKFLAFFGQCQTNRAILARKLRADSVYRFLERADALKRKAIREAEMAYDASSWVFVSDGDSRYIREEVLVVLSSLLDAVKVQSLSLSIPTRVRVFDVATVDKVKASMYGQVYKRFTWFD